MTATLPLVYLLAAAVPCAAAPAAVRVLEGPAVPSLCAALDRVGCPYRSIARLDQAALAGCRVLVLGGQAPPAGPAEAGLIKTLLEGGGSVLGVGGGAKWLIDQKLFDAQGYYPAGTTIHMSGFCGYHRLTFGYPGAKPEGDWKAGVPMLLRATGGPLMELGPQASSILAAGGPFSLAALQPVGKGLALAIGADPQGGNAYYSLDRPTPTPGDKLKTDLLLANAVAFLQEPCGNLIPNAGFEENAELPPEHSNWRLGLSGKATGTWCRTGAPAGQIFLRIQCPPRSSASVRPDFPIVVQRGAEYRVACLYKSSAHWTLEPRFLRGAPGAWQPENRPVISVSESKEWKRHETTLAIPADVAYVELAAKVRGEGALCLDEFTMERAQR